MFSPILKESILHMFGEVNRKELEIFTFGGVIFNLSDIVQVLERDIEDFSMINTLSPVFSIHFTFLEFLQLLKF